METTSKLGMNRTGVQMSPKDSQTMLAYTRERLPTSQGDASAAAAVRSSYIKEAAEGLGSVPVPGSAKGVVKSGMQMLKGDRPQALIDKLAERLAFERTGVRLYDALITKHQSTDGGVPQVPLEKLREIRNEEAEHFALLAECMQQLGCDPTAQTPSADLVGVESMGLLKVVTDPRTTFTQSLHAMLVAELTDHDGWDMLIAVTESEGQKEMGQKFRRALDQEQEHVDYVRRWMAQLNLGEARVGAPS